MTQPMDAANALLMGDGAKSIKWADHQIGYTVIGTIADQPKPVQMTKYQSTELDYWPSGDPKMQIVVTLQTDLRDPSDAQDEGLRRLYIEPRMMKTVKEAILRAGAPGLAIGGRIAIRWVSGSGQGEGNARQFVAEYAPPAVDPASMLGGAATPAPAAAPVAQAAPPAQPAPVAGMLGTPAAAPAVAPVNPVAQSLGITTPAMPATAPPGVDPVKWAALAPEQQQAVLAAMSNPAATAAPF